MRLYMAGFRHFILPLGYRGEQIQGYIDRDLNWLSARIDALQTGDETSIGARIGMVEHLLPDGPFLLVNGDCLFDLDFDSLYETHQSKNANITLTACKVLSQFGLFVVEKGEVVSFTRDSLVRSFNIENGNDSDSVGYVNAGITLIEKTALAEVNLPETENFEIELYSSHIKTKRATYHTIDNFWYAIETQKDLDIANSDDLLDPRSKGVTALRDLLRLQQAKLELGIGA